MGGRGASVDILSFTYSVEHFVVTTREISCWKNMNVADRLFLKSLYSLFT